MGQVNILNSHWRWNKDNRLGFSVPNIWTFLRSRRLMCIIVLAFLVVTYGMRMTFYSTTLDQDAIMNNDVSGLYNSWFVLGRFGAVFSRQVFGMMSFNPFLEMGFTVIFVYFACIAWAFLFYALQGESSPFRSVTWVFPVLFLTNPILAEQLDFLLQSFFVSLCIIAMSFALLLIYKWIFQHTWIDFAVGVFLLFWCFSVYQSFVPLFLSAAIGTFLLTYRRFIHFQTEVKLPKTLFLFLCIKLIAVFALSFGLYMVFNRHFAQLYGGMNAYITSQMLWGKVPALQCIKNILRNIYDVFVGNGIYYSPAYLATVITFVVVSLIELRRRYQFYWLYILAELMFVFSPFFMTIMMGNIPAVRTQFGLLFVMAFGADFFISLLPASLSKLRFVAAVLCLIMAFDQSKITSRLFYTEYVRYQQDVTLCTQIAKDITDLGVGEAPSQPVVLVGGRTVALNKTTLREEAIGMSTFEAEAIVQSRTLMFMETLGYNYVYPTGEQVDKGKLIASNMPVWPAKGSVELKDQLIVVKLS